MWRLSNYWEAELLKIIARNGKIVISLPETYENHVKENPIGSAISEILWYRQTNILLLYYKDFGE